MRRRGASAGACTECRLTTGNSKGKCSQTTLILCTDGFIPGGRPLLEDISGCRPCRTNCTAGHYVAGCTGASAGTCAECPACPSGERRVGCAGLSGGTCTPRGGLELAAEALGMSEGEFVTFITVLIVLCFAAAAVYGYRKREEHKRSARSAKEWEGRTIELEGMAEAEANMSLNPIFADSTDLRAMQSRLKTKQEMNNMIDYLMKANDKLKEDLKRVKISAQQGANGAAGASSNAFSKMKKRGTTKKEFQGQRHGEGSAAAKAPFLPITFNPMFKHVSNPPPPPPNV